MDSSYIKVAVVMYGTAIGFLWLATWTIAPKGYQFSWWRAPVAAVLMTITSTVIRLALSPLMGDWYTLLQFLAYILIVKSLLLLPFWRSALVATTYIGVVAGVYYYFYLKPTA